MSDYPLATKAGVTKRAIQKALGNGVTEQDLFDFIHGDVTQLHKKFPSPSGFQVWETTGKRFVHLEEARFVARHFLRNTIKPRSKNALVLSGTDPALACLPWAMSGLATKFVAYENDRKVYTQVETVLVEERKKVKERLPKDRKFELELVLGNVLHEDTQSYGVIDLDFCSNRIRTKESRQGILHLVDTVSPDEGPFVLRTTLHLGRKNNSREDIEGHIERFEKELRTPGEEYQRYIIRAFDRSPYQSSLPMVSLIWILERRPDQLIDIKELK